ncbi:hypothetical protein B9Z55_000231 [Caenorhabditis nigoni]|uniref:F-box domain-containing protein n=1 Tax=Caenorhabditis nigoni TaxID=1611254 RepID=A0A2G5VJW7_9PELO|nr:hypothetical protein B9Z55_000231 [Caenorhabditis nigoni]
MPPRFPLNRLPILVYEDVLKLLDTQEHFNLARTSKKSCTAVEKILTIYFPRQYKMKCVLTAAGGLIIKLSDASSQVEFETFSFYTQCINTVVKLFKISSCAELDLQDIFANDKKIIDAMKEAGCEISKVVMWEKPSEKTNPETMLNVLRNIPEVSIQKMNYVKVIPKPIIRPFEFKDLDIRYGKWISIKHLTETFIDCQRLHLEKSVLSDAEIKSFLKRWIEGSKMRFLCIEYSQFNLKQIIGENSFPKHFSATDLVGRVEIKNGAGISYTHRMTEGQCYIIKQKKRGPSAVVYQNDDKLFLSTEFKRSRY